MFAGVRAGDLTPHYYHWLVKSSYRVNELLGRLALRGATPDLVVVLPPVLYDLPGMPLAPLSEVLYLIQGAGPASNLSGFSTPSERVP